MGENVITVKILCVASCLWAVCTYFESSHDIIIASRDTSLELQGTTIKKSFYSTFEITRFRREIFLIQILPVWVQLTILVKLPFMGFIPI